MTSDAPAESTRSDFIREIIEADVRTGKHGGRVVTRFPPEPNGYLHVGHAKSICLNFGIAEENGSHCNLRFDDTNPAKEDVEYVDSIERDVRWLGFSFGDRAVYASDYFEEMYRLAEDLVADGKAYVDHLTDDEIKEYRGSLSQPGRPSPYRDRSVEENLDLLRQMRSGVLPDGACVLRARIDLAAPNMKLRDPLLYRIRHDHHHRTGDAWPIYPMYDYAHPISDAIEGVTHSLCTLEFENNRDLYDWVVEHTRVSERHGFSRPQQIEFARLNIDFTVLSKRRLLRLVEEGHVSGWDDPRMPTIAGMRRRGYRPQAIRAFADLIGVAKVNSTVDLAKLEFCVRDDLNWTAPRVLGVLRKLKVTLTSWPAGEVEQLTGPFFPADVGRAGERTLPFGRELWIDRQDFALDPPPGYHRLAPGRTVRLRHGYCITCDEVVEEGGEVVELRGHHVPGSVGHSPDGLEVSGVVHWVSAAHAVPAEVRLYDRLFRVPRPEEAEGDLADHLNPDSLQVVTGAMLEPSLAVAPPGSHWQLERVGYFVVDTEDSRPGGLVLNRVVTLRDGWQGQSEGGPPTLTPEPERREKSDKAKTRPPKRSRVEYRAEARLRHPVLADRLARWPSEHGISDADADLLTGDVVTGDMFLAALAAGAPVAVVARWIINELPSALGDRAIADAPITGEGLAALVTAVESGAITGAAGKEVLAEMVERGRTPEQIIAELGLAQVSDEGALTAIVDEVVSANPDKVAAYRGGKTALFGFFVGQVIRASRGNANPQVVQKLLTERLRVTVVRVVDALTGQVPVGTTVVVKGWIRSRRESKAAGGLAFLTVHDGSCFDPIQVVARASLPNFASEVARLTTGCSVVASGVLAESKGKGQAVEVQADSVEVVGWVDDPETYPLAPKQHSFEYLREVAHLRPRTNTFGAVTRVRHCLAMAIHRFFDEQGFFWVHTPIITANDAEGAGEMFRVSTLDQVNDRDFADDFFGRETHLTVSGQLNVEAYCLALSRVYTFGPTFRAENSNTARHLAEFWMVEPEIAFADLSADADLAEACLRYVCRAVLEQRGDDMAFFAERIDPDCIGRVERLVESSFERMDYTDAVAALTKAVDDGARFEFPVAWGMDLQSEHERHLTEKVVGRPVVVMNYPKAIKAFYMRVNDDGRTVAAMDVLAPGIGEIIGGSQREERLDILDARIEEVGLDREAYWWYRDLRRYGTVPHAGFGLGFERTMAYITGMANVRDLIPFPRTPRNADF